MSNRGNMSINMRDTTIYEEGLGDQEEGEYSIIIHHYISLANLGPTPHNHIQNEPKITIPIIPNYQNYQNRIINFSQMYFYKKQLNKTFPITIYSNNRFEQLGLHFFMIHL